MPEPTENEIQSEQREVEERTSIGAHIVHGAIRSEGEDELRRPSSALAYSGLAAGLSMGFSLLAEAILQARLPDSVWRPLITKVGYSVGFLIVILGRQQLFTENTLTVILPLLERKDLHTLLQVARLWAVVLAANLTGTMLFVWGISTPGIFDSIITAALADVAAKALPTSLWTTFIHAILAGWLIALMVWLLPAAESARVSIIVILTYLVGLGGFSHVIAGSTKVFYAIVIGEAGWSQYFGAFLPVTLLGNVIGGVALVAALGHAQVKSGGDE